MTTADRRRKREDDARPNFLDAIPATMLVLQTLASANVPLPGKLLRAEVERTYGRRVSAQKLATMLSNRRAAFTRYREQMYDRTPHAPLVGPGPGLTPALRPDGTAHRAWFTLADWSLEPRIIPHTALVIAWQRAEAALSHCVVPAFSATHQEEIRAAAARLAKLPLLQQLYSITSPP
ncbi:MAG: hypothetical protein ACYDHD_03545 [Vulcanimicrobiaceae bacterium]